MYLISERSAVMDFNGICQILGEKWKGDSRTGDPRLRAFSAVFPIILFPGINLDFQTNLSFSPSSFPVDYFFVVVVFGPPKKIRCLYFERRAGHKLCPFRAPSKPNSVVGAPES